MLTLQAFNSIPATRLDREGLETLDLEASSHPTWIRWLKSLSHDQAALLNVFRSGAVWTPTRRHAFRNSLFTACPFCAEIRCSARHLFAEFSHFNGAGRSLEFRWHVPPNFGLRSPGSQQSPDGSLPVRHLLLMCARPSRSQLARLGSSLLPLSGTLGIPIDGHLSTCFRRCRATALAVCHCTPWYSFALHAFSPLTCMI